MLSDQSKFFCPEFRILFSKVKEKKKKKKLIVMNFWSIISFFILLLKLFTLSGQMFEIQSCNDLQSILTENDTVIYSIINDIHCAGVPLSVVGDINNKFKGNYFEIFKKKKKKKGVIEGNNHTIKDLVINNQNDSYVGIFAAGHSCVVSNIKFKNITITSMGITGVLFGALNSSTLENLFFENIQVNGVERIGWCAGLIESSEADNIVVINSTSNALDPTIGNDFGEIFFFS